MNMCYMYSFYVENIKQLLVFEHGAMTLMKRIADLKQGFPPLKLNWKFHDKIHMFFMEK